MKFYEGLIPYCENPTFLGLRMDPFLSLKNQINYLSESCHKRLNAIKILSHKSWKLSEKTLVNIYTTLVRSIMEYYYPQTLENGFKKTTKHTKYCYAKNI